MTPAATSAPPLTLVPSKPISDSLQRHMDDVLSQIPSGKHLIVTGAVTTTGAMAGVGVTKSFNRWDLTGSGYAGKVWGGSGWEAGVRASISR